VETAGAPPLLPEPADDLELSGDLGKMVAALIMKTGREMRKMDEASRDAENAGEDREEAAQVSAMHKKANDVETQAWAKGAGEIVSGVCSFGSAAAADSNPNPSASSPGQLDWAGRSKLAEGSGDIISGAYGGAASRDDADAIDHEHHAAHAKRESEAARDKLKDDQKLLDDAVQFVRDYTSPRDQAALAAARRA
jgi:hypothetical protein